MTFRVEANLRYLRIGAIYYNVPSKDEVNRAFYDIAKLCREKLKEKYGKWEYAEKRLDTALEYLFLTESAFEFIVINEICNLSTEYREPALWNGGGTIISYLMGLTEINPLIPHYYCPKCKCVVEMEGCRNGFDLPEKICSHCGAPMQHDGHDFKEELAWISRGGVLQRPDTPVDVSETVLKELERWLYDKLGNTEINNKHYARIGVYNYPRYDLLYRLEDETKIPLERINIFDKTLWLEIAKSRLEDMSNCTFYDLFRLHGAALMNLNENTSKNEFYDASFCTLRDEICETLIAQGESPFSAAIIAMGKKPPNKNDISMKSLRWAELRNKVDFVSEIIVEIYSQWYKKHFPDAYEKAEWEMRRKSDLLYIKASFFQWE